MRIAHTHSGRKITSTEKKNSLTYRLRSWAGVGCEKLHDCCDGRYIRRLYHVMVTGRFTRGRHVEGKTTNTHPKPTLRPVGAGQPSLFFS
eukprot:378344-Amorphochlora_amoeboformis.AAC.2